MGFPATFKTVHIQCKDAYTDNDNVSHPTELLEDKLAVIAVQHPYWKFHSVIYAHRDTFATGRYSSEESVWEGCYYYQLLFET